MTDEAPKAPPAFPAKAPAAAAAPPATEAPPPPPVAPDGSGPTAIAAATAAPEEDDKPKVPIVPAGWGDPSKRAAPKRWSATARADDPTVRVVHAPLQAGLGDGKAFFFLFGFKRAAKIDQEMLVRELAAIEDDIQLLRNAGYTVIVD